MSTPKSKRPPKRLFVTIDDDCGPNVARETLKEAAGDADADTHLFGDTRVYEYRLVSKTARAFAPSRKDEGR